MPDEEEKQKSVDRSLQDINLQIQDIRHQILQIRNYSDGTSQCAFARSMEKPMRDIAESLLLMTRTLEDTVKDVTTIKKVLFGNGEQGMDDKVNDMEKKFSNMEKIVWIAIAGVIGLVINMIYEYVTHLNP